MTQIPSTYVDMVAPMRLAHEQIVEALARHGYAVEDYPRLGAGNPTGEAAAKAYPIQGILKYHGLADWRWRTAYLPSISVNNDAAYSLTWVRFDPDLAEDEVFIGGRRAVGREEERVQRTLDAVRDLAQIASRARMVSHNVVRATRTGKGLGTSASASAALAAAAIAAAFGREAMRNMRFLTCMARLLAGSGCRSAAGGVSLWLSYPGIAHEDSYAVRLDDAGQLDDLALITVPLDSRIGLKTEMAHHEAPQSSFYRAWMLSRCAETLECLDAVQAGDWRTLGQLAELDSVRLHGVTMSASRENKLFAWEPENIALFRLCNELRSEGIPVYFSTDTGPTTVFLTHREHAEAVIARIEQLDMGLEAIRGAIAGPVEWVDPERARQELNIDARRSSP
jgi:phosphomevalonate decarboxylase